jgi:cbb3-type cytochrome oxidase subunit 3
VRKRLTIALVAVLAVVLVAGGWWWWRTAARTDLAEAAALAPADAERLSWTDWSGVRRELGAELSASSSASAQARFLDKGYDADLTSTSALLQSAPVLQKRYGFSPASADWELFSQSSRGAVVLLRMPDSTDFDTLGDGLEELGYGRPSSGTGVWRGGGALLASIGADLTPELQYVSLLADQHLVLTSDTAGYLAEADDAATGDRSGDLDAGLAAVVDPTGDALSASVYTGDYTCSALAMSQADQTDQDQAAELVAQAGEVNPVDGFSMSVQPDRHVRVVLAFENDDQARTNADSRRALASGPAPGQGGDFSDRFSVASVTADGSLVRMDLVPRRGTYVLSDLSSGPVLFATC